MPLITFLRVEQLARLITGHLSGGTRLIVFVAIFLRLGFLCAGRSLGLAVARRRLLAWRLLTGRLLTLGRLLAWRRRA